jgi:hypothetical protein
MFEDYLYDLITRKPHHTHPILVLYRLYLQTQFPALMLQFPMIQEVIDPGVPNPSYKCSINAFAQIPFLFCR